MSGDRPGSYPATVSWTHTTPRPTQLQRLGLDDVLALRPLPAAPHQAARYGRPAGREHRAARSSRRARRAAAGRPLPRGGEAALPRSRRPRRTCSPSRCSGTRTPAGRRSAARSASAGSRSRSAPSARSTARSRSARSSLPRPREPARHALRLRDRDPPGRPARDPPARHRPLQARRRPRDLQARQDPVQLAARRRLRGGRARLEVGERQLARRRAVEHDRRLDLQRRADVDQLA